MRRRITFALIQILIHQMQMIEYLGLRRTFDGYTLILGEFPRTVSFECGVGMMINEDSYKLLKLNSDF